MKLRRLAEVDRSRFFARSPKSSPSTAAKGSSVYTPAHKHRFANLARFATVRSAAERAVAVAAELEVPAPSSASIGKWHKAVREAEKAALASAAQQGITLSTDDVERKVLDALSDKRSENGRRVPQDVVDSVAQFCESMDKAEMSFQRRDVRTERMATMEQMHPNLCHERRLVQR